MNDVNKKATPKFTRKQEEEIFKRDENKCVICGLGKAEGLAIYAVHIGRVHAGKLETYAGMTLCKSHNFNKKARKTSKKMSTNPNDFDAVVHEGPKAMTDFCQDFLESYDRQCKSE